MATDVQMTIYGLRIYRADADHPCVICANYPEGWADGGDAVLCERHHEAVRVEITKRNEEPR